jgi:hypothetical protein
MIYPINYMLESDIRNCFTYQTRFLGAPRFGSLPIGIYQKDHVDMHDNIVDRARHLGVEGQFEVKFTEGSLWARISGGRIRLGSGENFRRWREKP